MLSESFTQDSLFNNHDFPFNHNAILLSSNPHKSIISSLQLPPSTQSLLLPHNLLSLTSKTDLKLSHIS
jgi:hypothetical protein